MKNLIIVLVATLFAIHSTNAQKNFDFPSTPAQVVAGFYNDLAKKPTNLSRGDHAAKVFEQYFSSTYKEQGGKGNKIQNFKEFKAFVSGTFTQLPNLNVHLEEIVASGNHVTVKVKLQDKRNKMEINYLALYSVEGNKITARYAYSDGAF